MTDPPTNPPDGFHWYGVSWSIKWQCETCGAAGYPRGKWMHNHQRQHHPCPWCGRMLTSKLDGTPRVHTRCPKRPDVVG